MNNKQNGLKQLEKLYSIEFEESYIYCFFLHDRIAEVIVAGERYNMFSETIVFKEEAHAQELDNIKDGSEIVDWMRSKKYEKELNSLYLKQVFVALISDLCHFIYEALITSAKGKTTVAFALLRKPLKDNLYILENLLVNSKDFFNNFHDDSGFFNLANDKVNKETKRMLISNVIKLLNISDLIDVDTIYNKRYNKKCNDGFEPVWQQANHLITTCEHYKTEIGNINFIFSDKESVHTQLILLYTNLPLLLFYGYKIVMKLAIDVVGLEFTPERGLDKRVIMGFLKLYKEFKLSKDYHDLRCKYCGFKINKTNISMDVLTSGKIKCSDVRK